MSTSNSESSVVVESTGNQTKMKSSSPGFQIRTGDLFFLIAFAAAVSWAYAGKWTSEASFILALVFAVIVGFIFVSKRRWKRLPLLLGTCSFLCLLLTLISSSAIVFAHFLASCLLLASPRPLTARTFARASMICIAATLLLLNLNKPPRLARLLEARAEFPVEDLSSRLDYEAIHPKTSLKEIRANTLSNDVEARLNEYELWLEETNYGRREDLERIHSQQYENFTRALGFGVIRMRSVGVYAARTPEIPILGFNEQRSSDDENVDFDSDDGEWVWILKNFDSTNSAYLNHPTESLHREGRADFLNPETFGFIKSARNSAGFLPHSFHVPVGNLGGYDPERLKLRHLQLVSLLRFDQPRVYVLEHLPRMDKLTGEDVATRELNEFEASALAKLEKDEDVVVVEMDDKIRMLGSLRAANSCLECHDVQRGELLGAFTYEFVRSPYLAINLEDRN